MKRIITLFFLFFFTLPFQVFAWGAKGHALIAEVAFKYLDHQTKEHVLSYLGGMTIQEASDWMDEVRSDPAYNYMKPYHYADFEKGEPATALMGNNLMGVLASTLQDLSHIDQLTREEIKTRLLYLFHLVGDIHQPLHVGYPEDKGGNLYQVSFFGNGTNLHRIWDTEIIDYEHTTLGDVLGSEKLSPGQIQKIQQINIVAWASGSRSFLKEVYDIHGHKVGEPYVREVYPIIKRQLLYAGIRLAGVLEKYMENVKIIRESATAPSSRQDTAITTIDVQKAGDYAGKMVRVCARVYGTKFLSSSGRQPTFLDLGADYPNSPLTIVIWGDDRQNFKNPPEQFYKGKMICVTGKVVIYRNKPEIIVSGEDQIVVQ